MRALVERMAHRIYQVQLSRLVDSVEWDLVWNYEGVKQRELLALGQAAALGVATLLTPEDRAGLEAAAERKGIA